MRATLFQTALGVGQPRRATFARAERLGQLVAAPISQARVLLGVDRVGVSEDLTRDSLVIAGRSLRRIRMDLGAVDGEHVRAHQTRVGAQRQDLAEETGERVLVALAEPRDRRVIGDVMRGQDATRDVFLARALDRPRRPDPARVRIEQYRDHHGWIERGAAVPVLPIGAIERGKVHPFDRVNHKPREVPLGQPIAHVRRQQKTLLTIG